MIELKPTILLSANSAWNIVNYRLGLVETIEQAGYRVVLAVPPGADVGQLATEDRLLCSIDMQPRGTSVRADLRLFLNYFRLMRRLRPAAFLGFTVKPNVYGSLAARICGVKTIANISGLGKLFVRPTALTKLVTLLYRAALAGASTVFFQNQDDADLFLAKRLVRGRQVRLLPGSGVDLDHFQSVPLPAGPGAPITFLLCARLLWDKGIAEFVEAARRLKESGATARFRILGIVEPPGIEAVSEQELRMWEARGLIEFLGSAADVRPAIAAADCIVLPSYYREGVPRALLEGAAMGRPLITTDSPGCREAVTNQVTGFLCKPRSVESLVEASRRFLDLPLSERQRMGAAGRAKMEREFDQAIVHRAYVGALSESE